MEDSRSQAYPEQWRKTTASSSESPGKARTRGTATGRKRASGSRGAREARSPESFRGPGAP
eukprot:11028236-Heterocapsa_arctica.AAC.1